MTISVSVTAIEGRNCNGVWKREANEMKNLRKLISFILVLTLCFSVFALDSYFVNASEEIGFKSESNLRISEHNGKKILLGLTENTTFHDLLSGIYASNSVRGVKNENVLEDNDIVSTGTLLLCGSAQLWTVVKGDTTGDGLVDLSDLLRIKKYFMGDFQLDELAVLAADPSGDGEVNSTDYLLIKQYFLEEWNIYAANDDVDGSDVPAKMIDNGRSTYAIVYSNELERIAAYTLQETLALATGATLPVTANGTSFGDKIICFRSIKPRNVGNYGYAVERAGMGVTIYASELSGFDNAIDQFLSDCMTEKTVYIPENYSLAEKKNWETNYVLDGADYNTDYNAGMFYNDKNDSVAYVSNAMWHMFGTIDDGQNLVYRFGNEPTWFEWMSEKLAWSTDSQYKNELKEKIRCFPQTSTGYMWSWSTYPYWKVDDCYSIHYDGTFRYIAAVYDLISWEGNTQFLFQRDSDTVAGEYADVDASQSRTVLEKTEACMSYILEYLHGNRGYIQLTEKSTYLNADGSKRFDYVKDINAYCWNNTGKEGSTASNYWDNLCFGNYDAYSNALLYNALNSMVGIYRMLGGEYMDDAQALEKLAATVKKTFNEKYWSADTGRYIACIDTDGRRVDYGLTFHNFEILKYGLADGKKAQSILDWVDGDRVIAGEDRTGADIMSYGKIMEQVPGTASAEISALDLRLAAVTNTVSINNPENQARNVAWWHGPAGINVWGSAAYGKHLENGGYIFYPVFYELMARTEYEGAQSTTERLCDIAKVYKYNRLVSDASAIHSTNWLEGLNGEFPENGLVPTSYLYGLMGISAEHDGLHIAPVFNEVYEYMGVKELSYGGETYALCVNRDASCVITPANGTVKMYLHYEPERFRSVDYRVTIHTTDGMVISNVVSPDENGVINIRINETYVEQMTITPILK